jgi:diguanylate cyclase (GGDEF)-like protein
MPESHEPNSQALDSASVRLLRLAVYHRSEDVQEHLAPIRQVKGVEIVLMWQGTSWTLPRDIDGVLWELAPQDRADPRLAALLADVPAASYSLSSSVALNELSRALGFRQHLTTPVRLVDVERALGLPSVIDLADRLEAATPRLVRIARRTEAVHELMRAVNSSTNPQDVAAALVARVGDWLPLTGWTVMAAEPDGTVRRLDEREADAAFKEASEQIALVVVRSGKAMIRSTSYLTDRLAAGLQSGGLVEAAVLGWPLVASGETVGVLVGFSHGQMHRTPALPHELVDALSLLVEPAAYALSHALRVARVEALSVTDDLTQLYNSRFLNEALRKETKRSVRSGWPLSLLFIDLDGFKRINDAHGHLLGSRALIEAADIIKSSARETDIAARFGGDEFAILLPETGTDGAQSVARRLRDRISRHGFLAEQGPGNRITASIGVATLPDVAETAEGLLQAADAAMYRVKVHGKNGIHVAGSEADAARAREREQERQEST